MSDELHVLESLPAYALGCLDEVEARLVVEHLAGCYLCRTELAAFQSVTEQLALLTPHQVTLPPQLKHRLMERVQSLTPKTQPHSLAARRPLLPRLQPVWGFVAVLLILILVVVNLLLWQQIGRLEVLTGPQGMRAITLHSTNVALESSGFVVISSDGQHGVLIVDAMPQLDPQWQYQLWLVRGEQSISGAIFSVDETGYRGVRIIAPESLLMYSAVRITIEPAEGSPYPTGKSVMAGPLPEP